MKMGFEVEDFIHIKLSAKTDTLYFIYQKNIERGSNSNTIFVQIEILENLQAYSEILKKIIAEAPILEF